MSADLVERLRAACNGHPHAKIEWPHRILHEAAGEIERLRLPRWEPIATVPVPSAAELVSGIVIVDDIRRTIYTWTGRFLIQTASGYVTEATCRYIKKCATAKVEQLELRWYVGRVWERNAKYWMPLPAPKVET